MEEIFSGRTQVTSPCWLLQADAATLRRGGDGGSALLPPSSPQLMEIISPISAGRCQNGKIMSSSRATTLLELSGCRYSKMEFSNEKRGKRQIWRFEKKRKILINWIFLCSDRDFSTEIVLSLIKNKQFRRLQNCINLADQECQGLRKVRKSGGSLLFGGNYLPPLLLVELGLTDLPKYGGACSSSFR